MKVPTICRYCGGPVRLVPAERVFGASTERLGQANEMLYQCQNCNARVGCHKGTTRPLGDVANETLRLKRMETHRVFDGMWRLSRGRRKFFRARRLPERRFVILVLIEKCDLLLPREVLPDIRSETANFAVCFALRPE